MSQRTNTGLRRPRKKSPYFVFNPPLSPSSPPKKEKKESALCLEEFKQSELKFILTHNFLTYGGKESH